MKSTLDEQKESGEDRTVLNPSEQAVFDAFMEGAPTGRIEELMRSPEVDIEVIARNTDPEITDGLGRTFLHHLAYSTNHDEWLENVVILLTNRGLNPDQPDLRGVTATGIFLENQAKELQGIQGHAAAAAASGSASSAAS